MVRISSEIPNDFLKNTARLLEKKGKNRFSSLGSRRRRRILQHSTYSNHHLHAQYALADTHVATPASNTHETPANTDASPRL